MPSRAASSEPSQKSLGKRKASAMDPPASMPPPPPPPRLKTRVLPSRSRRVGGPGIGSSEVDELILDSQRRKFENEPLIPLETQLFIATDTTVLTALAGSSSTSSGNDEAEPPLELELNQSALSRYFDRPEVIRSCREQENIQTPEFRRLQPDEVVGTRFRHRANSDAKVADTSDEAYEKRHKKYETFEKRQRLREKEKLKHMQYKLRERIEQLRGMDVSAFLNLPASHFSPAPNIDEDAALDEAAAEDVTGILGLTGSHVNGAAAYNEGQRRREEMLQNALALEEKYAQLLPPDRLKPSQLKKAQAVAAAHADAEADLAAGLATPAPLTPIISINLSATLATSSRKSKFSVKKPVPARDVESEDGELEPETDDEEYSHPVSKSKKTSAIRAAPRRRTTTGQSNGHGASPSKAESPPTEAYPFPVVLQPPSTSRESPPPPPPDGMDVDVDVDVEVDVDVDVDVPVPPAAEETPMVDETPPVVDPVEESISSAVPTSPRIKRRKHTPAEDLKPTPTEDTQSVSSTAPPRKKGPAPGYTKAKEPCQIVRAAKHRSAGVGGRQSRNTQAFGCEVTTAAEMRLEYDFPAWAWPAGRPGNPHGRPLGTPDGDPDEDIDQLEEEDGDPPLNVEPVKKGTGRRRSTRAPTTPVRESTPMDEPKQESDETAVEEASDVAPNEMNGKSPGEPEEGPPAWSALSQESGNPAKPASVREKDEMHVANTLLTMNGR